MSDEAKKTVETWIDDVNGWIADLATYSRSARTVAGVAEPALFAEVIPRLKTLGRLLADLPARFDEEEEEGPGPQGAVVSVALVSEIRGFLFQGLTSPGQMGEVCRLLFSRLEEELTGKTQEQIIAELPSVFGGDPEETEKKGDA